MTDQIDPTNPQAQTTTAALRWSSAWTVEPSAPATDIPNTVVLSGGADRRIAIDGLPARSSAAVASWSRGGPIEPVDDDERLVVDRLVELGAVVVERPSPTDVTVTWTNDPDSGFVAALKDVLAPAGWRMVDADLDATTDGAATTRPLRVVVRTGSAPWPVGAPPEPHLGVDLTLHHTVLIGPYVVPGASACLDCLDLRVARRWGRPAHPATPGVTRWPAAVAALVAVQVDLIVAGTSSLVNATIAWDLERGTTDRQSLYKMIGCPTCDRATRSGRVALPWTTTRR